MTRENELPQQACRIWEEWIDRLEGEGLSDEERARLFAHLDECARCSEHFELLGLLRSSSFGRHVPEAGDEAFAGMRRAVLGALTRDRLVDAVGRESSPWHWTRGRLAQAAGLAAVLFAAGALSGWVGAWGGRRDAQSDWVDELRAAAVRQTVAGAPQALPFELSDIRVRPTESGSVQLSFAVSRRLELEVAPGDPLLHEAVVQSIEGPSRPGSRIGAIELASVTGRRGNGTKGFASLDPRVRQALVDAMRYDPDLGVRLAAQEKLAELAPDERVTAAMLEVLREEEAMQMRLAAIDYLAEIGVAAPQLASALESVSPLHRAVLVNRAGQSSPATTSDHTVLQEN